VHFYRGSHDGVLHTCLLAYCILFWELDMSLSADET
jgi:hypothetical protein